MQPSAEQERAETTPIGTPDGEAERAALIEEIRELRQLLAPHDKMFDSRGKSVFAQTIRAKIDEKRTQLARLYDRVVTMPRGGHAEFGE